MCSVRSLLLRRRMDCHASMINPDPERGLGRTVGGAGRLSRQTWQAAGQASGRTSGRASKHNAFTTLCCDMIVGDCAVRLSVADQTWASTACL